jgi:chaperonin GroEL (HSP60 family)
MDPIDAVSEMQSEHAKGNKWVGVNGVTNKVTDLAKINVYEPMVVKAQAIKSATEAATLLLKIDDIIAVSKMQAPPGPPGGGMGGGMGGMPPGMGGMPGMM